MIDHEDISFERSDSKYPFWPDAGLLLQLVFVPITICFFLLIATGVYLLLE